MSRAPAVLAVALIGATRLGWSEVSATAGPIEVSLKNGSERERQAEEQLKRLVDQYRPALDKWLFTKRVVIEQGVIPHSHPVLTLNVRHLDDDERLLSTFVHEQIHWFVASRWSEGAKAVEELARMYPDAPDHPPEGARDKESTYLHLLVCHLEYQAMKELLGDAPARAVIQRASRDIYRWVYGRVLEDQDRIKAVVEAHRLAI